MDILQIITFISIHYKKIIFLIILIQTPIHSLISYFTKQNTLGIHYPVFKLQNHRKLQVVSVGMDVYVPGV